MKKLILAALAVSIGFASCSKDGGTDKPKGENAIVRLKLHEKLFSKGVIDDIDTETTGKEQDAVLVKGDLWVFIAQGEDILVKESIDPDAVPEKSWTKADNGENLTTDVDKIIIIANAPTDFDGTSVSTVADLNAKAFSLDVAQTDYLTAAEDNKIWVQGESGIAWKSTPAATGETEGTATISLHPVLSRIDATINLSQVEDGIFATKDELINARIADESEKGGIVINSVSVLYSAKESSLTVPFTPSTLAGKDFYSGMVPAENSAWGIGKHGDADLFEEYITGDDKESFLFAPWTGTDWLSTANPNNTSIPGDKNYTPANGEEEDDVSKGVFTRSFYAFSPKNYPADGNSYKAYTILTIHATQYNNKGEELMPRYFSAVFSEEDVLAGKNYTQLEPGVRYRVAITMDGDFSNGGGGGTTPEEKGNAKINIVVNEAEWSAVVDLNKTFGPGN